MSLAYLFIEFSLFVEPGRLPIRVLPIAPNALPLKPRIPSPTGCAFLEYWFLMLSGLRKPGHGANNRGIPDSPGVDSTLVDRARTLGVWKEITYPNQPTLFCSRPVGFRPGQSVTPVGRVHVMCVLGFFSGGQPGRWAGLPYCTG